MNSLDEWINELQQTDQLILVEGEKDKAALNALSITNVLTVSKTPIHKIIEEVVKRNKRVVILTDLDREGKKYYATLRHQLQKQGVKIDTTFREFLFKETTLSHIEGLTRYRRKTLYMASKIGSPVLKL